MKTTRAAIRKVVLPLLAIVLCRQTALADATTYSIFKTALYHQTTSAEPTAVDSPHAYFWGAQLYATATGEIITNVIVIAPGPTAYPMSGNPAPTYFIYNSPYFTNKESLDTNFPSGLYDFEANSGMDSAGLTYPTTELYAPEIPYFTGDTWRRLQAVNTALPLNLSWNPFTPNTNSTSAFIFVNIIDSSGYYAFYASFLPSTLTNYTVPANTLNAESAYTVQVIFSTREDGLNMGFTSDASSTAGFDLLTYTTLTTLPPLLSIAPGTNAAVLSWPISASNFKLESAPQLSPAPMWSVVTNIPTATTKLNVLIIPTANQTEFYRLYLP